MKPMKRKGKKDGSPLFHKCSVLGCGCPKSYLYFRSDSQAGGVYLCDACAKEMIDFIHHPDNAYVNKITEIIRGKSNLSNDEIGETVRNFVEANPENRNALRKALRKLEMAIPDEPMTVERFKNLYPEIELKETDVDSDGIVNRELWEYRGVRGIQGDKGDKDNEETMTIEKLQELYPDLGITMIGLTEESEIEPEQVTMVDGIATLTADIITLEGDVVLDGDNISTEEILVDALEGSPPVEKAEKKATPAKAKTKKE